MTETTQPDPEFTLRLDPWGRLVYIDEAGTEHPDAVPVRAYPITDPGHWVILCDAHGREVRCIEDLAALPVPVRTILEEELARREFVPRIRPRDSGLQLP